MAYGLFDQPEGKLRRQYFFIGGRSTISIAANKSGAGECFGHERSQLMDIGKFFIRPAATLIYYDLQTVHVDVKGYQYYADRYDVNGGADFGHMLLPEFAAFLGYRYGYQYRSNLNSRLTLRPAITNGCWPVSKANRRNGSK